MDLTKAIVLEVADILDARDQDHTLVNRLAVLNEMYAERTAVYVYGHDYLDLLIRAIIWTTLDIRELV